MPELEPPGQTKAKEVDDVTNDMSQYFHICLIGLSVQFRMKAGTSTAVPPLSSRLQHKGQKIQTDVYIQEDRFPVFTSFWCKHKNMSADSRRKSGASAGAVMSLGGERPILEKQCERRQSDTCCDWLR